MYAKHLSTKNAPVTRKVKATQVANNGGGYSFALDKWQILERFLILGNEGGTYYCTERKMTEDNARCVLACASEDLSRTLKTICDLRDRAPKQSPAIFALALLISNNYDIGNTLNTVCKTGTQLFEFVASCNELRGWGSRLKKVVSDWYLNKDSKTLAYQVTKYAQRDGWSHRDVLRLCHAKTEDAEKNDVFKYVCQNEKWQSSDLDNDTNDYLAAVQEAKHCDANRAIFLINEYNLVRECLGTHLLNDKKVWEALLDKMPMMAMLRNLGKMSQVGLLGPLSQASQKVIAALNEDSIRRSKIHPLNMLVALHTYSQGRGMLGSNTWNVDQNIVSALDSGFYHAFSNVVPTNKRFYLGIDCSGSMGCGSICGSPLTPVMGAAVMAMSIMKKEPVALARGFNNNMIEININKNMMLNQVITTILRTPWGSTNCAAPMQDAMNNKLDVDCFIIITDNECNTSTHPFQALKNYRNKSGIDAKMVVIGMTSTGFTIADPSDKGSLDVVGFDSNVPALISDFVKS